MTKKLLGSRFRNVPAGDDGVLGRAPGGKFRKLNTFAHLAVNFACNFAHKRSECRIVSRPTIY